MLKIKNIIKSYKKENQTIFALYNFSLSANKGEIVTINGPSGCGKTTLLLTAGGLLKPDSGEIIFNDQNIYDLSQEKRAIFRAHNIGFVFQQYHLIPYLNVFDNIRVPALARNMDVDKDYIEKIINTLGLKNRIKHTPSELSAGEKQRTALARALVFNPDILLADEITGNLDKKNSEIVMHALEEFKISGGSILLVTHDSNLEVIADKNVKIMDGKRV